MRFESHYYVWNVNGGELSEPSNGLMSQRELLHVSRRRVLAYGNISSARLPEFQKRDSSVD